MYRFFFRISQEEKRRRERLEEEEEELSDSDSESTGFPTTTTNPVPPPTNLDLLLCNDFIQSYQASALAAYKLSTITLSFQEFKTAVVLIGHCVFLSDAKTKDVAGKENSRGGQIGGRVSMQNAAADALKSFSSRPTRREEDGEGGEEEERDIKITNYNNVNRHFQLSERLSRLFKSMKKHHTSLKSRINPDGGRRGGGGGGDDSDDEDDINEIDGMLDDDERVEGMLTKVGEVLMEVSQSTRKSGQIM